MKEATTTNPQKGSTRTNIVMGAYISCLIKKKVDKDKSCI